MTTAYTSLLGLALPVTGELSGTWGDTVNTAITSLLDTAVAGTTSITVDADITLTTTTGASNQARQAIILWNPASGTVTRNITAPAQSKLYTVINASGGTQSIVIRGAGPTTGVTIAKGESAMVAWNGSDFVKVSSSGGALTLTDLTVTGNTILGDAAADTLTVNATSTFASPVNFQGQVRLPSTGRSAAAALTPTNPAFLYGVASTYTDTTSSGTLAPVASFYGLAQPTLSTSNVTTYTTASTLYIANAPATAGSATITNPFALYVAAGNTFLGGNLTANGTVTFNGDVNLGDAGTDGIIFNGRINSNMLWLTDNAYDIGASGATRPRNIFLAGTVTAAGVGAFGGTALDSNFGVSANSGFKSLGDDKGLRLLNTNADGGGFIQANTGTGGGVTVSSDAGPLIMYSGGSVALTLSATQLATFSGNVNFNGNIGTNITFGNNANAGETTKFIRGNAYGGAIRFAANGSTATDRGLQLGIVNNSSAFTQVVSIDGDSLFVSTRGGINSNSTALQLNNDSTTLSSNNFFTINNRGAATTQTSNYIIGGLLFGGYRDIRNPANVAGIYAERVNYASGLSSLGRLYLSTAEGDNIAQGGVLPNTNYAVLTENGDFIVGSTTTSQGRITSYSAGTGAIQMFGASTGNGSVFGLASAGGAGQYMATSATGDSIVRVTANSLCIGTASAIKFGTTTGEFGRFESGGSLLLGTTSTLNGNPRLTVSGAVSLIGGNSIYWDGTARAPTFTVAYDGSLDYLRIGSSANQGNTVGSYIDFFSGPSNNYVVRGRFQSDGSFKVFNSVFLEQDSYNIYLRYVGIAGVYRYAQKFINADIGSGDDPGYHYVALCRAYSSGGAVDKSVFVGQVFWSRGSSTAGNNNSAVQVCVSSGYLSNETGGVNFGSFGANIVKFTAAGIDWIGVRMSNPVSNASVTVIGFYASSQAPTLYLDGAVSSVTVLKTLPAAT